MAVGLDTDSAFPRWLNVHYLDVHPSTVPLTFYWGKEKLFRFFSLLSNNSLSDSLPSSIFFLSLSLYPISPKRGVRSRRKKNFFLNKKNIYYTPRASIKLEIVGVGSCSFFLVDDEVVDVIIHPRPPRASFTSKLIARSTPEGSYSFDDLWLLTLNGISKESQFHQDAE